MVLVSNKALKFLTSSKCYSYCEVKLSYHYGKEQPYDQLGSCRSNAPCTITKGTSIALATTYEFNANTGISGKRDALITPREDPVKSLTGVFNSKPRLSNPKVPGTQANRIPVGASISWTTTKTSSTSETGSRPESNKADCGYWTFIPYLVT